MWCSFPGETLYFFQNQIHAVECSDMGNAGRVKSLFSKLRHHRGPPGRFGIVSLRSIAIIYYDGMIILPSGPSAFYSSELTRSGGALASALWQRIELRSLIFTHRYTLLWRENRSEILCGWVFHARSGVRRIYRSRSSSDWKPVRGWQLPVCGHVAALELPNYVYLQQPGGVVLERRRANERAGLKKGNSKKNAKLITSSVLWVRWDNL